MNYEFNIFPVMERKLISVEKFNNLSKLYFLGYWFQLLRHIFDPTPIWIQKFIILEFKNWNWIGLNN